MHENFLVTGKLTEIFKKLCNEVQNIQNGSFGLTAFRQVRHSFRNQPLNHKRILQVSGWLLKNVGNDTFAEV